MNLNIITQLETLYRGEASSVTLPGSEGQFTVLPGHTVIVSRLRAGDVKALLPEGEKSFHVKGGLVEVQNDTITVLAHTL